MIRRKVSQHKVEFNKNLANIIIWLIVSLVKIIVNKIPMNPNATEAFESQLLTKLIVLSNVSFAISLVSS
jgi:hypothetical protein